METKSSVGNLNKVRKEILFDTIFIYLPMKVNKIYFLFAGNEYNGSCGSNTNNNYCCIFLFYSEKNQRIRGLG